MKNLSLKQLNESTFKTIKAFDASNPIGCYFVAWQDGFELYVIKVEFCDSIEITEQDAFEAAEEISDREGFADYICKKMY
jgi:hypothetical protein